MASKETAVSAKSLVPYLYDQESDDSAEDEEEEYYESKHEDVVDDLSYDVFNLTACNYHPIQLNQIELSEEEEALNLPPSEAGFLSIASRSTQLLISRLFQLPVEKSENGPLAILPPETLIYPREKPIPQPKPETKWEKFAKEKGIKNKKRERMLYDEADDQWKPRYGYKSVKGSLDDVPIVEVKNGQDPYADPWEDNRKEKKAKIAKNLKNQENNRIRSLGGKKAVAFKYDSSNVPGIPIDVDDKSKKRGKEGVRKTLQLVQHSTQSLGRFDEMRHGEPKRQIKGKKRVFRDNLEGSDHSVMKAQLRIVEDKVSKKARGITNSLKSYEGLIPDAPSFEFKSKKGKGKLSRTDEKKGKKGKGKGK